MLKQDLILILLLLLFFFCKYLNSNLLTSEKLVTQSVEENQLQLLVDILHELLIEITVVESSVPFDKLVATLQWIIDQHEIIPRLLLYTFSIIPENSRLNKALLSVKIDKSLLLLILDPARLISLNLHTSLFEKKIVRANTNFLYKQKRFNLLREESEGYTKLVVELQGASCGVGPHNKMEAQVLSAVNAIQSLIGYFDLDPVRSLDIIFDIFAMNIVRNSEFYLNVLKQSTWWPIHLATHGSLQDLSQGGNSMAAQIIGFKLKSYSQLGENVPDAYMMLVAVLIKEGFICLGDIYPFLSPSDDELLKHEDVWKKEMEEKTYMARASALALAAPLVDDDDTRRPISAGNSSSEKKHSQNDTVNKKNKQQQSKKSQKAQLLSFLLSVGSLYPSLFILSKFPFLPGAYPEIADMVNRLVEYTIEPLFLKTIINTKPTPSASLRPKKIPVSAIRDTELDDPRRKGEILVLHPPVSPVYDENRYRFFYSDWSVGLATVDSIEGLQSVSEILLKYSGPLISRNARLLVRICRIAKYFLQAKDNEEFWYEYFRNYILGAISVVGPNPGIIHEIFLVMQYFPFEARYALYGEWSAVLAKSNPHLKFATSKAEKDTKDVLKRLSKTNVREMMRRLAKISYANPIPSFTVFISQVESYDNLGDLVVEAARYFTDMGWDILPFVIMLQLTSGRGTIQSSGMSDRKWIQSLSSFSAKLCKRYSLMDSSPIVLYLLKEFHSQIGSGIILLRDLIAQMAGITQLSNLAKTQIEALGGCPSLRTLVFESIGDKRSISSRSGKRLADVLTNLNIASELFIILCQTHKGFIYTASDETAYQKVLAHRYDELTHVLIQYTELLNEFMDQETFENNMISISELCTKYGISPTYAFELWRNVIANKIRKFSRSDQDTEVSLSVIFFLFY